MQCGFESLARALREYPEGLDATDGSQPLPHFAKRKKAVEQGGRERPGSPRDPRQFAIGWQLVSPNFESPTARTEATLSRIGAGEGAVLVLFGGRDAASLAPPVLHLFDPREGTWSSPSQMNMELSGEPPSARAGHTAGNFGRHLVLIYGGKTASGLSDEVSALVHHRPEIGTLSKLSWCAIETDGDATPGARAYHAVAEMADSLMLFGGEVRMRMEEVDELGKKAKREALPLLPPLHTRTEASLVSSTSTPTLRLFSSLLGSSTIPPTSGRLSPSASRASLHTPYGREQSEPSWAPTPRGGSRAPTPAYSLSRYRPGGSRPETGTSMALGRSLSQALSGAHSASDASMMSAISGDISGVPGARKAPPRRKHAPALPRKAPPIAERGPVGEWPPTISKAERNARIVNHPLSDLWRLVRSSPAGMAAAEAARAAQSAPPGGDEEPKGDTVQEPSRHHLGTFQEPKGDTLGRTVVGGFTWQKVEASGELPTPRSRHSFLGMPSRGLALLFAGRSVSSKIFMNDLYVLDTATLTWMRTVLCGVPPVPRDGAASVVVGSELLVYGGGSCAHPAGGRTTLGDAHAFRLGPSCCSGGLVAGAGTGAWDAPWRQMAPSEPRHGHVLATLGTNRVLQFGGMRDDGSVSAEAVLGECAVSQVSSVCIVLTALSPKAVFTTGGAQLTIRGAGFRSGARFTVRFRVRRPLPPHTAATKPTAAVRLASHETVIDVPAELVGETVDGATGAVAPGAKLVCETPALVDLVSDALVTVDACMDDLSGAPACWSSDELELRVNCIPVHVAGLRPLGARPAAVPVSTRTIIHLKAIDVRGRRPILEMPFHVQLQPKPKRRPPDAAAPPPPAAEDDDANGAAPVTAAPAPATPGNMFPAELAAVNGFELLAPVPGSRATMRFMGHGVYEIEMLTDAMGAFELVVTSPPALPTPLLVYARMPLTATPGATHPASCRLHVGLVDVGPDGTLHTVAGNSLPLSVDVFDHVANVVDGRDGGWTYQCDGLAALESIAATTFTESIFWADPPTGVARKPFDPLAPLRLKLTAAGIYELAVKFIGPVNEQIVPAAGVAQPDASDTPLDPKTNLPMSTARPVRLVVAPSALSVVHCTVRGSGLHSRWKDLPELEEREILFIARDHYGNPLGRSPPALASLVFKVQRVTSRDAADATADALAALDTDGDGHVSQEEFLRGMDLPCEVTLMDDGHGNVRCSYRVASGVPLCEYALSVSLGGEVLYMGKISLGTSKDRPKNAPHWSKEKAIFAIEHSVAQERADHARKAQEAQADALAKERFARQFRKADEEGPTRPGRRENLRAAEIFGLVDTDGSGTVEKEELAAHMKTRGYSDEEIASAMSVLDVDGDGKVTLEEFTKGLESADARPELEDLLKPFEAPETVFEGIRASGGCDLADLGDRAISLAQLKRVYVDQVVNRCSPEGWIGRRYDASASRWSYKRLTPESVNMYDLISYVVLPGSGPRECAFVELLATAPQPTDWFVSVPWSTSLLGTIRCLEAHARDHGLDEEAKYWLAPFALNQHDKSARYDCQFWTSALASTPLKTSFATAWSHPCQGIVSIVDEEGECFRRSWIMFETLACLSNPPHGAFLRCVYTPFAHEYQVALDSPYRELRMAVGLLLDRRARDAEEPEALETLNAKARREASFPLYLIERGLELDVKLSEASRVEDRTRILNSIIGNETKPKSKPPKQHEQLDAANAQLQGDLAAFALTKVIDGNLVVPVQPAEAAADAAKGGKAPKSGKGGGAAAPKTKLLDEEKHASLLFFLGKINTGKVRRLQVDLAAAGTGVEDGVKTLGQVLDALDAECIERLQLLHTCAVAPPMRLFELSSLTSLSLAYAPKLLSVAPARRLPDGTMETQWSDGTSFATVLPNLTSLDLSGLKALEALPDDLFELRALTSLILAGCSILEQLPEPLGPLKLTRLDVSMCPRLYVLPDLSGCVGLEVQMKGCLQALIDGWPANGRKAINVEYALY